MQIRSLLQHSSLTMTNNYNDVIAPTTNAILTTTNSNPSVLLVNGVLSSITSNPLLIGTAWMISSAIFTTYTTTKFIKYKKVDKDSILMPKRITNKKDDVLFLQQYIPKKIYTKLQLLQQLRFHNIFNHFNNQKKYKTNPIPITSATQSIQSTIASVPSIQPTTTTSNSTGSSKIHSILSILSPSSKLTMYRFAGSLLFGLLLHFDILSLPQRIFDTIQSIPSLLIPSICLFIANFSNTVALDRIGIGLTYTSKCGIPIITVLLTVLLDGIDALPNIATLITLLPIAFGIAAASWSVPTYEVFGFIMASISATAQSLLNVTSKRSLSKAGLSGPVGQRTMAAIGLLLTIIMNTIQIISANRSVNKLSNNDKSVPKNKSPTPQRDVPPFSLTIMAMMAYHIEYLLSFIFVTLVGPITYGICDAIRRLCIILFGRLFFGGDPLTKINKIGIASALGGAVLYSIASSSSNTK